MIFHTLKAELIRGSHFDHDVKLRFALNSYINQFYNHRRMHSGIGYMPPAYYERMVA
ncbi:IS3 family transposase [Candidatus Reidiella endopervernicosa]|uniref:IS3 family transposase n=1 Tax=Candidatus Reidiella endopervernicosa TaxID=2738883 RepID=A0A6N0I0Z1_9GAMM|nr:IS3 family transposase [Candidatus Reidiella endopervernicosa]